MKTLKTHSLYAIAFLIIILLFGVVEKTLFSIAIYSMLIVLGALLIAWGAEASEIIISESLALAIVAWLQVFPEFIIEATITWAQDIPNMLSNFTGANRILVGIGWPLVFFVASFFYKKKSGHFLKEIKLKNEHSVEIVFFLIATVYSVFIFLQGSLTVVDSIVMGGLYIVYLFFASKLPHMSRKKDKKLIMGIPKQITNLKKNYIKPAIIIMFLTGGIMIFFVAEPFYNNALILAGSLGISQFLFIQWVAPFLSEFPEKTSAFYWASKIKQAPMALMNLISSKLTQWTMLLAMIPVVFSVSVGSISSIPLNSVVVGTNFTISTEFLITIASSFYAVVLLLKLRLTWLEALSLLVLWILQFIFIPLRPILIWVYFGLAVLEIIVHRKEVMKVFLGFRKIFTTHVR